MEYPNSSSIPFPFPSGPYPQQAALMDTILQSLQIVDEEYERQQEREDEEEQVKVQVRDKGKANVMILESPTGTGKSLSLACASLAWLRYREQRDLKVLQPTEEQEDPKNVSTSKLSEPTKTKTASNSNPNWLDDWVPPEQIEKEQQRKKRQDECYQRANSSRLMLQNELQSIRAQITRRGKINIRHSKNGISNSINCNNSSNNDKSQLEMVRSIRAEIVKEAVEDAKKIEHQKQQQKQQSANCYNYRRRHQQNQRSNCQSANESATKKNKLMQNHDNDIVKDGTCNDFCVDEYMSDNDANTRTQSKSSMFRSHSSEDEDDDHEDNDEDEENKCNNIFKHTEYEKKGPLDESKSILKRKNITFTSAQYLLDGGQLDGSGLSSMTFRGINQTNALVGNNYQADAAATTTTTIGSCEPGTGIRKIIYAARTHSQLSQFVNEVRRTAWGDSVRIVTLGGRKLLCGNPNVTGSGSSSGSNRRNLRISEAMITERCLDLQKGLDIVIGTKSSSSNNNGNSNDNDNDNDRRVDKKRHVEEMINNSKKGGQRKKKNSCPYKSSKEAVSTLALHMLAKPSDIEDLVDLGGQSHTCAYYASRESLKAAEVVVVPYNTLLSKPSRKAVGLSLKSSLVIIDEAHNIPEALRSLSSCQLTLPMIEGGNSQLSAYVKRYSSRLAGRNIFYLGQIRKILVALAKHLKSKKRLTVAVRNRDAQTPLRSEMVTTTELLFALKLDNINLFNIIQYLNRSRLSQKLLGFTNAVNDGDNGVAARKQQDGDFNDPNFISKHISCMSIVEAFLKCLSGTEREGRVVVERPSLECKDSTGSTIARSTVPHFRYLLLDPAVHFKDVIRESHAVILAGGTLRPFPHIATELFGDDEKMIEKAMDAENNAKCCGSKDDSHISISRTLTTFSCGHVVSSSNVFVTCLSNGPNDVVMDFRHNSRSSSKLCNELGMSVLAISSIVPNGLVVFFPSYSYELHVVQQWKAIGLYKKIHERKKIYREPKLAGDVEKTLGIYSKNAATLNGAILLCVINGKMSEGINFSNDMARCVLVVGLPYPDITNPELQEKMQLLDKNSREKNISISGQAYYQNLCMRAVNQSIGRAIRHINDFAAIILADVRYSTDPKVWDHLPVWLRGKDRPPRKMLLEGNIAGLKSFFEQHHFPQNKDTHEVI